MTTPTYAATYRPLPPHLAQEVERLRAKLAELHRQYLNEAEPYVTALARIEAMRAPDGFVLVEGGAL